MAENSEPKSKQELYGVSNVHFCPKCKKPLRRIAGKMGPFWGCSGFPQCAITLNDVDGVPSQLPDNHYRCPVCTRKMIRKQNKQDEYYWYCTGFRKGCDVRLSDQNGRPETAYRCKACGHLLVRRQARGEYFWGCSRYPECTATHRDSEGYPEL